jgi:tRNA(fMet)-specific endonuclease VapC
MRPQPNPKVQQRLLEHHASIALAATIWHELLYGLYRLASSARRKQLENYVFNILAADFPILDYTQQAALWHAQERARLVATGRTPGYADSQIAAIAATNQLTLVTRNVDDFADFEGLKVQNWFA